STGFIIGPGIGGFLAYFGSRIPFFAASSVSLLSAIASFLFLTDPERYKEAVFDCEASAGLKCILNPIYFIAFIIIFITQFGLSAFDSIFSLFVDHIFGFTPKDIAIIITGGVLVGALGQVFLFGPLTKRLGEVKLIRYAFIL